MNCDCEKDRKASEFHNRLDKLLDEYRGEEGGLEPFEIMDGLSSQLKIEACLLFSSYYHALGICTEMLLTDFEEMFHDINSVKEEENAPDTL